MVFHGNVVPLLWGPELIPVLGNLCMVVLSIVRSFQQIKHLNNSNGKHPCVQDAVRVFVRTWLKLLIVSWFEFSCLREQFQRPDLHSGLDTKDQLETLNSPPLFSQTVTAWIGEKVNVVTWKNWTVDISLWFWQDSTVWLNKQEIQLFSVVVFYE